MEVLDSYKFKFAETMNQCKSLSALMSKITDVKIEHEIESAVCGILEKHGVDLNELMKQKYPQLHSVYSSHLDKKFDEYPGSVRMAKIERLIKDVKGVIDEWSNTKEGKEKGRYNINFYHGVMFSSDRHVNLVNYMVSKLSSKYVSVCVYGEYYTTISMNRVLLAYGDDLGVNVVPENTVTIGNVNIPIGTSNLVTIAGGTENILLCGNNINTSSLVS